MLFAGFGQKSSPEERRVVTVVVTKALVACTSPFARFEQISVPSVIGSRFLFLYSRPQV